NHAWGQSGHRRFIRPAGVAFREEFIWRCRAAYAPARPPHLTGWLTACVHLESHEKRKRDTGNSEKFLLDCLAHAGIIDDDYQIRRIEMEFAPTPYDTTRVCLALYPYEPRPWPLDGGSV
ncbi:MAG: RusA family crossover junction endodeoxyribonuclease, partial [Bacteroidota bacterium]